MRLPRSFYTRDALEVAPELLGKLLVNKFEDGYVEKKIITEVEIYRGEEDLASHSRFGKTNRNKVMYEKGGLIYVYFIYGMYWMLNIVTGSKDYPQAILVRGVEELSGPGKVGKWLNLDKSYYGEDLTKSKRIWIENSKSKYKLMVKRKPRVGIDYAGKWKDKKWRYLLVAKKVVNNGNEIIKDKDRK